MTKPPEKSKLVRKLRCAVYPGEHDAIIDRAIWDRVHAILTESPRKRAARTRSDTPALLKGLLFGPDGAAFSPTHTRKGGRLYRYYVSQTVLKHGAGSCPIGRVPAGEIEAAVIDQLRALFRQPEIVASTWRAARVQDDGITEPADGDIEGARDARQVHVHLHLRGMLGLGQHHPFGSQIRKALGGVGLELQHMPGLGRFQEANGDPIERAPEMPAVGLDAKLAPRPRCR